MIRPGGIGDTILSFPAMEHLCVGYTEVWVRSEVVPLVQFAGRVRAISSTGIDLMGIDGVEPPAALTESMGSFDEIWTWYGANRPEFRSALALFRNDTKYLAALPVTSNIHAADFFMEQVGGEGPAVPRIGVGEVAKRPSIVFHPFSGSERKNWPLERFEELAGEFGCVEWAARRDWVCFENLLDLARWIAGARVYVGNDSGIAHLAAAAGARVIALFGPTDPAVWAPRGSGGITILRAPRMVDISMAAVRQAILAALTEPASSPDRGRSPRREEE